MMHLKDIIRHLKILSCEPTHLSFFNIKKRIFEKGKEEAYSECAEILEEYLKEHKRYFIDENLDKIIKYTGDEENCSFAVYQVMDILKEWCENLKKEL